MHELTSKKLEILRVVAHYSVLLRTQIQRIVGIRSDRHMRAMLQQLCMTGLLQKTRMQVVNDRSGAPAPVYFSTKKGLELIAGQLGDEQHLHVCTRTPDWQHLFHWVSVSETHVRLDEAVRDDQRVELEGWFGEWDEINPTAKAPEDRFRLYTLLSEKPRLVCVPDAAFALAVSGGFSKTYYLEVDRGTSGIRQIASSKSPGYFELFRSGKFRRHFPTAANSFSVLHVSPTPVRRDLLRKAFATKAGNELHFFCAWNDWVPEKLLKEPIFYGSRLDTAQPLIDFQKGVAA